MYRRHCKRCHSGLRAERVITMAKGYSFSYRQQYSLIQLNCGREIYLENSRTLHQICPTCCDEKFSKALQTLYTSLIIVYNLYNIHKSWWNFSIWLTDWLIEQMQSIRMEFSQNNLESSWFNLSMHTINCRVNH